MVQSNFSPMIEKAKCIYKIFKDFTIKLFGEKKTKRICGRGDSMDKITSSENIFPFIPFLAGKKKFAAGETKINICRI